MLPVVSHLPFALLAFAVFQHQPIRATLMTPCSSACVAQRPPTGSGVFLVGVGRSDVEEKAGFCPNIFRALWRRPKELESFWNYHDVVMEASDELSKLDKEMIVVATSGENRCHYCGFPAPESRCV